MEHLPRSRCLSRGLSACTAAILVAGCGGSPLVAPLSGAPALPSLDRNASGGASQSYIGAGNTPRFQYTPYVDAVSDRAASPLNFSVLHSFAGGYQDGSSPFAGPIDVHNVLYGTTVDGGPYEGNYDRGGTVFSITTGGTEKVLHFFGNGTDGSAPIAPLADVRGTLYGTTESGGTYPCGHTGCGTVFSITTGGVEKALYSFGNGTDGAIPFAGLIDVNGTLYGTTQEGGTYGYGTVFSITRDGTEKMLHSFGNESDGLTPDAALTNLNGTLYGTTFQGGAYAGSGFGVGTVFSITTGGTEKVLHSFGKGTDGAYPRAGLMNVNGTLYGTTEEGGSHSSCVGYHDGCGTVFSVTVGGTEKVLHSFGKGADGSIPVAGLINVNGTLYGTTEHGGEYPKQSYGIVFRITTSGIEKVVYNFGHGCDCGNKGFGSEAPLIDVKGTLYGTTELGGADDGGVVFALRP
jgi:uncharacterized repeat protein (TIGR03803 family)